jgi:ABC-type Mn2+/Zn2+ transport system permease subunit
MDTLREILDPQFTLRNSIYISLLVGLVCPVVGVYLVLRRLIFLGVALPQISSAGIALSFALPALGLLGHGHVAHVEGDERMFAFIGALSLTFGSIVFLAMLEQRERSLVEGRIGTAYVLAGAASILLLVKNPMGERGMLDLLKGEIIAVSNLDLILTLSVFALVGLTLFLFEKEFLLVSFDREMAITLNKKVFVWDCLLFLLIGGTISIAVLSVGPLVTFGFLLIPPLVARQFARNMLQFIAGASFLGAGAAFGGFCLAYRLDLPVGPTDVALLGSLYVLVVLGKLIVGKLGSISRAK